MLKNLLRRSDSIFKSCFFIDFWVQRAEAYLDYRPTPKMELFRENNQSHQLRCMIGFQIRLWRALYRMLHERNWTLLLQLSVSQQLLGKTSANNVAISITTDTLLKSQISVDVFAIEDLEYVALRKELFISHREL